MIDLSSQFSVSQDRIDEVVQDEKHHSNFKIAQRRAQVMATWAAAEYDEFITTSGTIFSDKSYVIKQSGVESNAEYQEKLERIRLFPLEQKFLSAQQRIYDENNVNRRYPEGSSEFWEWKERNFDDQGASITEFYRDKVMYVKETLGFGAIITDIMMNDAGETIVDPEGKPVPYNYVVMPHEIYNFEVKQGQLVMLATRQKIPTDASVEKKYKWQVFTPSRIQVYHEDNGTKELVKDIENRFGEVPATLLKGDVDPSSSFMIGKPRRYALKGLYKAASELFYDLQKGSELFAHPIPAYSESIAKSLAGVKNEDDEYDAQKIKEQVGMIVIYPDDMEMPSQLFYQADMSGLQHLRDVIFKDLMSLIFLLAKVRDKSIQKSNVSGSAKAFDNVEEQGLLAQTAQDMQDIEREVCHRMARVREEDPKQFLVNYSKHYDLSSADEIWDDFIEGVQYGGVPFETKRYQLTEYMRKRSAPQEVVENLSSELDSIGLPVANSDAQQLAGVIDNVLLQAKLNPQLVSDEARAELLETREQILAMRSANPETVETESEVEDNLENNNPNNEENEQ